MSSAVVLAASAVVTPSEASSPMMPSPAPSPSPSLPSPSSPPTAPSVAPPAKASPLPSKTSTTPSLPSSTATKNVVRSAAPAIPPKVKKPSKRSDLLRSFGSAIQNNNLTEVVQMVQKDSSLINTEIKVVEVSPSDAKVAPKFVKRFPLAVACRKADLAMVKFFVDNKAVINFKGADGLSPFWIALEREHWDILRYLVKEGARIESRNSKGLTPLSWAVKYRKYQAVGELLVIGGDVNGLNKDNTTPVLMAADHLLASERPEEPEEEKKIVEVLELILRHGGDVNKAKDGATHHLEAMEAGRFHSIPFLIRAGANTNAKDKNKQAVLTLAVRKGPIQLVQSVLSFGAFVNSRDKDGNTALMLAIMEGKGEEVVRYLVQHGASPDLKNARGLSSVDLARKIDANVYMKAIDEGSLERFAFPGYIRRPDGKVYGEREKAKLIIIFNGQFRVVRKKQKGLFKESVAITEDIPFDEDMTIMKNEGETEVRIRLPSVEITVTPCPAPHVIALIRNHNVGDAQSPDPSAPIEHKNQDMGDAKRGSVGRRGSNGGQPITNNMNGNNNNYQNDMLRQIQLAQMAHQHQRNEAKGGKPPSFCSPPPLDGKNHVLPAALLSARSSGSGSDNSAVSPPSTSSSVAAALEDGHPPATTSGGAADPDNGNMRRAWSSNVVNHPYRRHRHPSTSLLHSRSMLSLMKPKSQGGPASPTGPESPQDSFDGSPSSSPSPNQMAPRGSPSSQTSLSSNQSRSPSLADIGSPSIASSNSSSSSHHHYHAATTFMTDEEKTQSAEEAHTIAQLKKKLEEQSRLLAQQLEKAPPPSVVMVQSVHEVTLPVNPMDSFFSAM